MGNILRAARSIAQSMIAIITLGCDTQSNDAAPNEQLRYFSADYREARQKFLERAGNHGARIASYHNMVKGPHSEPLAIDVASFGPADATAVLVLVSGTHGVEGFAGSALQTGLLGDGVLQKLPPQTGLVMIHALNPYGFAHLRRVNEDNIDLNRNFLDHTKPHPLNEGYLELAEVLAPSHLSPWSDVKTLVNVQWYRLRNGTAALRRAISGGQYTHADGLFFGGLQASWSNTTLRAIIGQHLAKARRVALVEIHTGLGRYAGMEAIMNAADASPEVGRARKWLGDLVRTTDSGQASSAPLYGTVKLAIPSMLAPDVEVTALTLEFGTLSRKQVMWALRSENWLFHHGDADSPEANEIKHNLLHAFYPEDDEWKLSVWQQGQAVVYKILDKF